MKRSGIELSMTGTSHGCNEERRFETSTLVVLFNLGFEFLSLFLFLFRVLSVRSINKAPMLIAYKNLGRMNDR